MIRRLGSASARLGIALGPSWFDVIMDRPELRDEMARRLAGAAGAFETGYTGALYGRPVGRGLILQDAADRRHVEEWVEQALRDAGLLNETDTWAAGGRTTEPVRLTLRIERPPAP